MPEPPRDDFVSGFAKLWVARALEGESQITETVQWNVETKGRVPLVQGATAAVGLLAVVVGLFLLSTQAGHLLALDLELVDYLLVSVLALLALLGLLALVRYLSNTYGQGAALALTGALLLLLLAGVATALRSDDLDLLGGLALATGLCLVVPGLALAYRQLVDLVDPFGKTSPLERALFPYLPQVFGVPAEEEPKKTRLVPRRRHGQVSDAVSVGGEDLYSKVEPDDLDLVAFVRVAAARGLSRTALVKKPRVVLRPTGTKLTRPVYDKLLARAAEVWGFVNLGGDGVPHTWAVEPDKAVKLLEEELAYVVNVERG